MIFLDERFETVTAEINTLEKRVTEMKDNQKPARKITRCKRKWSKIFCTYKCK